VKQHSSGCSAAERVLLHCTMDLRDTADRLVSDRWFAEAVWCLVAVCAAVMSVQSVQEQSSATLEGYCMTAGWGGAVLIGAGSH
jgi:hypothetical protein